MTVGTPTRADIKLENLPHELLIIICEELVEAHRPSVASFSLTSKACRRAAAVAQHRQIQLKFEEPQKSLDNMRRWMDSLTACNGFMDVRRLDVEVKPMLSGPEHDKSESWQLAWVSLSRLVQQLRGLADLTYDSERIPFPGPVLAILHSSIGSSRTACRLHVKHFHLPSLVGPAFDDGTKGDFAVAPEDLQLAMSPALYSISLELSNSLARKGHIDFTLQAVQQLVQGGNSRVKIVEVYRYASAKSHPRPRRPPGRERVWHGFTTQDSDPGTLNSLRLADRGSLYGIENNSLQAWSMYTDFALLRTLRLSDAGVGVSSLQWLIDRSPTRKSIFPRLTCLELEPGRHDNAQQVATSTQTFLRHCLPPLKELTLSGGLGKSIDTARATMTAIMRYHGHALLRLALPRGRFSLPTLQTSSDAHELVRSCPLLEVLETSVSRSSGDSEEVAIYRTLGSHPRLREIRLQLDCTLELSRLEDAQDNTPWKDHPFMCNGHVRHSLKTSALDSSLAIDIFQRIATARVSSARRLRAVEIKMFNVGKFRSARGILDLYTLRPVFDVLGGRTFRVFPHPNNAHAGEVIAESLRDERFGEKCVADQRVDDEGNIDDEGISPFEEIEPLFRGIWPRGTTEDWRNDWHSFRLTE